MSLIFFGVPRKLKFKFFLLLSLFLVYKLFSSSISQPKLNKVFSKTSSSRNNSEKLKQFYHLLQSDKLVSEGINDAKSRLLKKLLHVEFYNNLELNGTFFHSQANKPKDILFGYPCFDHSRVVLSKDHPDSNDYINANFVDGYLQSKKFILTQCE